MKKFLCTSRGRVFLVPILLLAACGKSPETREDIRPVRFQKAEARESQLNAHYSGEVQARHESALGFRIGGKIVERYVDVGARVQPGTVLARLDAQDVELNTLSVNSQLAAAQADFDQAALDLKRSESLAQAHLISRS